MKKFLSFLTAVCSLFACAFATTACSKGDPATDWQKKYAINQTDWVNAVNTDCFTIQNQDSGNAFGYYVLVYNNNMYNLDLLNRAEDGVFVKKSETEYVKAEYSYDQKVWIETSVTKEKYDGYIQGYISALEFIKDNRGKFKQDGMMYEYTLDGTEQELSALQQQIGLKSIRFGWSGLTDGSGNLEIQAYFSGESIGLSVYFNTNKFSGMMQYVYETAAKGLNNFTITGGPSETDVDYCELKVTSEGLHAYYPNKGTSLADKERYVKANGDDTYTQYVPVGNGGWSSTNISAYNYEELTKQIVTVYLGEFEQKIKSFNCQGKKLTSVEGYTWEMGKYTYSYYDFVVQLNEFNEMESMTWKMKIKDNALNAESLEYVLTLTAGNTTIEYPNA